MSWWQKLFPKQACRAEQTAVVLGHGYRELADSLGSPGFPVVSGESVADIRRQMPEVCPDCGQIHSRIWIIGFCGFRIPGKRGGASSESEIKQWGDRYLDTFRAKGAGQLLKHQEDATPNWYWDMSSSFGNLMIKCNPGGTTKWLYEVLTLMEQTAAELHSGE